MKKFITVLLWLGIILVSLLLTKNLIAKGLVQVGAKVATGLDLEIKKMDVNLTNTFLSVEGLKLHNPKGYPDKVMVNLPLFFVDYDVSELLKGVIHLYDVRVDLEELLVVKNADGELNIDTLKPPPAEKKEKKEEAPPKPGKAMPVKIDAVGLKIGKVVFKDYSKGGEPVVKEFQLNIDERHEDISNFNELASLIAMKILSKTTLASLANIDIGVLDDALKGAGQTAAQVGVQAGAAAQEQAAAAKAKADAARAAAQEKLGGTLNDTSQKAGEVADATKEKAAEAVDAVDEKAKELMGSIKNVKLPFGKKE